jgi:hypothetical protein
MEWKIYWKDASLLFNSSTSNELSACIKQEEHVLNCIGLDFRAMRENQLKNIGKIWVHSFVNKLFCEQSFELDVHLFKDRGSIH